MFIDRKPHVTVICMHCGDEEAKLFPPVGDRADYSCSNCGDYSVSGMMQKIIKNGHTDPRLAHFVEESGRRCLKPSSQ
jgi:hypothetical protein